MMRTTNQEDNTKNRKAEGLLVFFIGVLAVVSMFVIWALKENINNDLLLLGLLTRCNELIESLSGDRVLSLFTSQLSLTFITISVMSVLSDKTVTLYWINLVEDNLIRPPFRCFYAYVIYSFSTIAINLFAIFFRNYLLFIIFFIVNFIILFLLTHSMLTVYFRQDSKDRKAIKDFKEVEKNQNFEERSKKVKKLKEYTLKAYSNYDIDTLNKNLEFYSKYCKVEDVAYFLERIDGSNIELLGEVLLSGFENQIKEVVKNYKYQCLNKNNIRDINLDRINVVNKAFEKYNIINMIPQKLLNNMISNESKNEYYQFYEQLLTSARSIMILHFNFIAEKEIIVDNIKKYEEFRHIIRDGIRKLKNAGITGNEYNSEIYEYEKQRLLCLNEEMLSLFFNTPTENFYAFHEGMKKLPTKTILNTLKDAMDNGNHYFITVFISTFQQFPIFKYMCRLDANYSNNMVYNDIQNICNEIKEKGDSLNDKGEVFLNPDWTELFREIFGK